MGFKDILATESLKRSSGSSISKTQNAVDLVDQSGSKDVNNFTEANVADRALSLAIGGLAPAAGGASNAEESLPVVLGALGAVAGSTIGHPNIGLGFGTAGGDILKQTVAKLKGDREDVSAQDAIILGGIASLGGKIFESVLKAGGMSLRLIPERARKKLFDSALDGVNAGKKQLSINWEKSVNRLIVKNPDSRVNLSPTMKRLQQQFSAEGDDALIPQLKSAVSKNKRLLEAVDDPDKAIGLTLREANDLKAAVTSTTNAITRRASRGKTTPNERAFFEIIDEFDEKITSGFEGMKDIRAAYKKGITDFNLARPLVEPGKQVEAAIFSKPEGLFGLRGSELFGSTGGRLATKDILQQTKDGAKLFDTLKLAHNVNRAADAVGRLGEIAVGGALVTKFGFSRNNQNSG